VNCCVAPSVTLALVGETVIDAAFATRVTFALAEPLDPVAVTVTVDEDGMVAGAV
jgi:hypothetical protein